MSMGGRRMGDPCLGSILPVQLNILKDTWGLLLLQISVNNISVNAEHCLFLIKTLAMFIHLRCCTRSFEFSFSVSQELGQS